MALDPKKKPEEDEAERERRGDRLPPLVEGDRWWRSITVPRDPAGLLQRSLADSPLSERRTSSTLRLSRRDRDSHCPRKAPSFRRRGLEVSDLLVGKLGKLFDVGFTARMEEQLDQIEEGSVEWAAMLTDFYEKFQQWMERAKVPPADTDKVSAVLEMLAQVTDWAPPVQRGRRTYSDEHFVASVKEQLEAGVKAVTDRQLSALVKIALRYRDQIHRADQILVGMGFGDEVAKDQAAPSHEEAKRRFEVLKDLAFSESQAEFIDSLRQQVESGIKLTGRQLAAIDRIIVQNAAQIEQFDQVKDELGLIVGEDELQPDTESPLLLEMLRHVTAWQEPVTRGKRTFDDHVFFTSLEEQYGRKKSLSPRQRYALKRMAFRYKDQIPEFEKWAEKLGLGKQGKGKGEKGSKGGKRVPRTAKA